MNEDTTDITEEKENRCEGGKARARSSISAGSFDFDTLMTHHTCSDTTNFWLTS